MIEYGRTHTNGSLEDHMERAAGILMPVSSLPSPCGIGTLGKETYRFVDFLQSAGCSVWQVLPLQPTGFGNSPYSSSAEDALNPYFIDFDFLKDEGLLEAEDYRTIDWGNDPRRVDYGKQYLYRKQVLKKAFRRFDRTSFEWVRFIEGGHARDFGRFMAIKEHFGGAPFSEWGELSVYDEARVEAFEREHEEEVLFWRFTQYLFLKQWHKLKAYANAHGVKIMGDMPIYLSRDSLEVWKYGSELFLLDPEGKPSMVAGVPPDAFSDSGQLWGNPLYDWEKLKESGYAWWHKRIERALSLYDMVRIDHFIGFIRYYCIPSGATAREGTWRAGPGKDLFKGYESAPIVAEDLGLLTDEIRAAIREIGYPGMRILQHAFDGNPENEHKPSNYPANVFAYTGTHDNEPLLVRVSAMKGEERARMLSDLKKECVRAGVRVGTGSDKAICSSILRLLYASPASAVVFPLQDCLCMGEEGRINAPSVVSGENWSFRFLRSDFSAPLRKRLFELARRSGRK